MALGIPSHFFLADVGSAIILLDVRADRYRRIGGNAAAVLRGLVKDGAEQAGIGALIAAGLIAEGSDAIPVRFLPRSQVRRSALDADATDTAIVSPARIAVALVAARARLRLHGLARCIEAARDLADAGTATARQIDAELQARRFEAARAWLPIKRKCLPDALALHAWLVRAGASCSFVIGVRDLPFAAHAWVEAGDAVLSDRLDTIVELTPILRV